MSLDNEDSGSVSSVELSDCVSSHKGILIIANQDMYSSDIFAS
jgi:hypothetical protein